MKRSKIALVVFLILAILGTVAVESNFSESGSVYCDTTLTCTTRVAFKVDPAGTAPNPCSIGTIPAILTIDKECVAVGANIHFSSTRSGK